MNLETTLLLGSIIVPALGSLLFFYGFPKDGEALKKLGYIIFGFPCFAGIVLFLKFDSADGYCFEFLYDRMGLQELGITFHLALNGVSSPLFAMAGIVGFGAGIAAIHSGADRLPLYLALLSLMLSGLMGLFASVDIFFYYLCYVTLSVYTHYLRPSNFNIFFTFFTFIVIIHIYNFITPLQWFEFFSF